ncbi:unnamed protein product, partial [Symbiodinium sp. CCMP2456]
RTVDRSVGANEGLIVEMEDGKIFEIVVPLDSGNQWCCDWEESRMPSSREEVLPSR